MIDMVEIDIDFDYCGEVEMILAHDECGEHEDVEFYRNDLLASENAKLRELVRDMYIHIDQDSECPMCGYEPDGNMYTERVREFGIEVDDGGDNRKADNREPSQSSEES